MSFDKRWEDIHKKRDWGSYPSEHLVRFVLGTLKKKNSLKSMKILEVGCGTGANLWFLIREGLHVFAIDGSRTAVEKAEANLSREFQKKDWSISVADAVSLPFSDETFDAVVEIETVTNNNFKNSKRIYAEIFRTLKSGGMLFSQTFATGTWGMESISHNKNFDGIPTEGPLALGNYLRFTPESQIESLLEDFDEITYEKSSRTYMNRTRSIDEWIIVGKKN